MTTMPVLTIGIPTFNRADAVAQRVEELSAFAEELDIAVVVSDNASTDGTKARLSAVHPRVRVVRNEKNLGYAGNVFRLFDEATTPYLTIVSDEDRVNRDGLATLIEFCSTHQPRMVSPRAQVGKNTAYRGLPTTRAMTAVDYHRAAYYVSGLTFSTEAARRDVELVRTLVPDNSAATVYPQVLLSALAVAQGDCHFLDALVTTQVDQLATHITESSGASYTTIAGRWAQFLGYEEFFAKDLGFLVGADGMERLQHMREQSRDGVLKLLLKAATAEAPQVSPYFQRSALRYGVDGLLARIRRR